MRNVRPREKLWASSEAEVRKSVSERHAVRYSIAARVRPRNDAFQADPQ